jgi:hypothetical protein
VRLLAEEIVAVKEEKIESCEVGEVRPVAWIGFGVPGCA